MRNVLRGVGALALSPLIILIGVFASPYILVALIQSGLDRLVSFVLGLGDADAGL